MLQAWLQWTSVSSASKLTWLMLSDASVAKLTAAVSRPLELKVSAAEGAKGTLGRPRIEHRVAAPHYPY